MMYIISRSYCGHTKHAVCPRKKRGAGGVGRDISRCGAVRAGRGRLKYYTLCKKAAAQSVGGPLEW